METGYEVYYKFIWRPLTLLNKLSFQKEQKWTVGDSDPANIWKKNVIEWSIRYKGIVLRVFELCSKVQIQ